jgi:hypothetical protein
MTFKIDGTNGVLQQYDYQTPTTGFSYTFAAGTNVLVMQPAGTLATGTIIMPASPADGMTITISSTQVITALTIQGNTGQSIVGQPTVMNAGGAVTFVYRLSNTTWYAQVITASITTGVPVMNVYTSPGTWTKAAGLKAIKVTVVGSGGAAGTVGPATAAGTSSGGGGGGAAILIYPAPSLPGPQPYTVGATAPGSGNSSSFGVAPITVITATGGGVGSTGVAGAAIVGGAGGAGSNGSLNISGQAGAATSFASAPAVNMSGGGGSSILGLGGANKVTAAPTSASPGSPGNLYGGGGGGAFGSNATGGTGAAGVVIVEEFY